jgi:Concanavalin A-like lectin/glucanases superfamily/Bacterial Ig domain
MVICLETTSVGGATLCVGPSATGSGLGADWNNQMAWSSFTPIRGNTYYLATGSYGARIFTTPDSGTQYITIKKAIVTDHGSSTGWVDSMGTGQAVFSGVVNDAGFYICLGFYTDYWLFDGQTRDESNWFDGSKYGFSVSSSQQNIVNIKLSGTLAVGITGGKPAIGLQLKNIYIAAPYHNLTVGTAVRQYAIDCDSDSTKSPNKGTDFLISRCYVSGGNNIFFIRNTLRCVVEYCAAKGAMNNDENHGEVFNCYYGTPGAIIRYNKIYDAYGPKYGGTGNGSVGTAVIALTDPYNQTPGVEIYGNVFSGCCVGDGIIGYAVGGIPTSHNRIYNNTFVNGWGSSTIYLGSGTDNIAYNNLWINCGTPGFVSVQTHDYNGSSGGSFGESHQQINIPTSIFANYAQSNYSLASATAAGISLASPYNIDMTGTTRGGDGTWERGAFEFGGVNTNPVMVVSPSSRDFASVTVGATSDLTLTVQNSGGSTLSGTASVPVPFSIVAGGTYSLGASQSQTVTVRFSPSAVGNTNGTVTFTGAGGANATVSGIGAAITDPTPPTVTLTGPANGVTVSNKLIMTATASDNVGVLAVAFFVNGTQVSSVASSPYSCTWDSVMFANGTYQVYAQARDAQGNVAWSSTNSITVNNIVGALPTPAAYWSFNEGAGTAARSSVSTNALTLRSGATWSAAGKDHASLSLDGVTGRAEASSSTELGITGTAITVSAWVNLQSQGTWQQIVAKVHEVGASTSPYFSWHLFGAHASSTQWTPQFQLVNSNGVSANVTSSINVNYGQWAHIVGVYDGSAVRIYVNGVDRGSAAQSGNIVDYSQPLYIGASGLPDEFARGLVDEVRVYSVALSAAQVTRIYEIPCNVMVSPISN